MTRKVYGGSGIIALAATLRIASASAGPCAEEIAAQLEHQPTHEWSNTQRSRPRRKS
jgi:hypothetical protein